MTTHTMKANRQLIEIAERLGYAVERTAKNHLKCVHKNGKAIAVIASSGDYRGLVNAEKILIRELRKTA